MAYENGIVDSNPMSRVKRLREPEPRQRYLNQFSDDEEERLMKALAGYGEHVVALVELDLEVGMRLGELLNARREDVDKANELISIIKTKVDGVLRAGDQGVRHRRLPLPRPASHLRH